MEQLLASSVRQLTRILKEYVNYVNRARPHQGIEQKIPKGIQSLPGELKKGNLIVFPMLKAWITIIAGQRNAFPCG